MAVLLCYGTYTGVEAIIAWAVASGAAVSAFILHLLTAVKKSLAAVWNSIGKIPREVWEVLDTARLAFLRFLATLIEWLPPTWRIIIELRREILNLIDIACAAILHMLGTIKGWLGKAGETYIQVPRRSGSSSSRSL